MTGQEQPDGDEAPSAGAARALEILRADQVRTGNLDPDRVDSLLDKRALDAVERSWIYNQLGLSSLDQQTQTGLDDPEESLEAAADEESQTPSDHVGYLLAKTSGHDLLNGQQERILGQIIKNGEVLRSGIEAGSVVLNDEVAAAIARADEAQRHMVLANIRLVVSIAKAHSKRSSLPLADLVQEGIIGLMRAVRKFDPGMNVRLATYATWWIRQAITRAIGDTSRTIRIPIWMIGKITKLRRTMRRLVAEEGDHRFTLGRLAAELGWEEAETTEVYAYSQMHFVSSDDDVADGGDKKPALILIDPRPTPDILFEQAELSRILDDALEHLAERDREVIERRFGLAATDGNEETLEQIGLVYGVTRERIRQIEKKALLKLGRPYSSKRLVDFT